MILRNAKLADERQPLSLTPRSARVSAVPIGAAAHSPAASEAYSPPPWNLDSVLAWLASQSVETRGACAQALAPDIHALAAAAEAEGLERGRAAGLREVESRAASALAALARLVASAEESLRLESAQLAESCTEIVAEAFVKLAGPRLASREAVVGAVLTVLARVKDERELTIRVNGADLPLLEAEDSGLRAALGSRRWTLTADSRVAIGGCLVESALGTLDGRIDVQLHELGETLRAAKNARLESA